MEFTIKPSRVAKGIGGAIFILVLFSLIGQYSAYFLGHGRLLGFVHQFDLGAEGNIATYFATFLLLSASLLLGIIAYYVWRTEAPFRLHWAILALIFAYLSVDEFAMIHESLNRPMEAVLEAEGVLYYPWVVPAMGVLLLFGIAYTRFFWHLSRRWKYLFAASGIIYVAGAIGIELFGARYISLYGEPTFTYEVLVAAEEGLEMVGVTLFIYALLEYLRVRGVELHISLEEEKKPVSAA